MKLTIKQKRDIESEIPDKYDYMDKLPMKGWAWEFLRRNKKFMDAFNKLEELVEGGVWSDECKERLSELQRLASNTGLLIGRISSPLNNESRKYYLTLKMPPYEGDKATLNIYFGSSHHIGVVPRPENSYYDYFREIITKKKIRNDKLYKLFLHPPLLFIYQIPDYKIYESFNELLNEQDTIELSPESDFPEIKPTIDRSNDVFYVAVSKSANIADLKDFMLDDIAKIIKKDHKPKIRKRKWKYYLIVYDLRQKFNADITDDDICNILNEAYPEEEKEFCASRNIENWNDSAVDLINGGYIKYLKPTIPSTK